MARNVCRDRLTASHKCGEKVWPQWDRLYDRYLPATGDRSNHSSRIAAPKLCRCMVNICCKSVVCSDKGKQVKRCLPRQRGAGFQPAKSTLQGKIIVCAELCKTCSLQNRPVTSRPRVFFRNHMFLSLQYGKRFCHARVAKLVFPLPHCVLFWTSAKI